MPNRIIKETIRTSRTVNSMSDWAFRVWAYLITYVDDYGRGSADPELIKGLVFPRRKNLSESDIEDALKELAGMGCISLYEVDGESYFCFPSWGEHQRIQTKKSKFPAPTEQTVQTMPTVQTVQIAKNTPDNGTSRKSTVIHGDSPWITVGHGELPPESNPIQSESNTNPNPNPYFCTEPDKTVSMPENDEAVNSESSDLSDNPIKADSCDVLKPISITVDNSKDYDLYGSKSNHVYDNDNTNHSYSCGNTDKTMNSCDVIKTNSMVADSSSDYDYVPSGVEQSCVCNDVSSNSNVTENGNVGRNSPENQTKPFVCLPLNNKTEYPIYREQVDKWQELYPAVDICQQLRSMKGWLESNPNKRKTKSGILRFINGWLAREQDRGRNRDSPHSGGNSHGCYGYGQYLSGKSRNSYGCGGQSVQPEIDKELLEAFNV